MLYNKGLGVTNDCTYERCSIWSEKLPFYKVNLSRIVHISIKSSLAIIPCQMRGDQSEREFEIWKPIDKADDVEHLFSCQTLRIFWFDLEGFWGQPLGPNFP